MRQAVLPSHDAIAKLKSEGKIVAGGYKVGERAAAFIFEAESNEELDGLLQGLPFWGLISIKVSPLEDVGGRKGRDLQQVEQMEQMLQR